MIKNINFSIINIFLNKINNICVMFNEGEIMIIESHLIRRIKQRDEEAFEIVYRKYEGLIYYIALSITKNKEDAEEIVQDTFLNMFKSIETYEEKNKFKQWLMQIARNLSYNKVTRNKEKNTIKNEEYVNNTPSQENMIENILTIERTLDEQSSYIVICKVVYNFSFKEIANDLNMTVNQVQGIYYQSLKKLKKVF